MRNSAEGWMDGKTAMGDMLYGMVVMNDEER